MNASYKPPERATGEPRHDVPQPAEPGEMDFDGRRKHPSDYHADCAMGLMVTATNPEQDSMVRDRALRGAEVYATLSLRDAVLEASATYKESSAVVIETNAELSQTLKKVGRHVITELRKATVKEAPEQEAEAGAA